VAHLFTKRVPAPADWRKGRFATDRLVYDIATRPPLLARIARLIGSNVVLWGADVVKRSPGQVHPWHSDIEAADPNGGFLTVWIGLKNTSRESALQMIAGSHLFGEPIQQVAERYGAARGEVSAETVLAWARKRNADAAFVLPAMQDGEALLFDGRLWHGSDNARSDGDRIALLLQYARADKPVRMPDFAQLEWPFRFFQSPRPPVILVRGRAAEDVNRLVLPPLPYSKALPVLSTLTREFSLSMPEDASAKWKPYPLFRGATRGLQLMNCHMSVEALDTRRIRRMRTLRKNC
jgi:hypothetical protein